MMVRGAAHKEAESMASVLAKIAEWSGALIRGRNLIGLKSMPLEYRRIVAYVLGPNRKVVRLH